MKVEVRLIILETLAFGVKLIFSILFRLTVFSQEVMQISKVGQQEKRLLAKANSGAAKTLNCQ